MPDMNKGREFLWQKIENRRSVLCIGLDTDPAKLPPCAGGDILFFNKKIIDATRDQCVAYKLNFAFYESEGARGWDQMDQTIGHIGDDHLIIADAKRGDIGNTSAMYARAVFEKLQCDAITVNPYMGRDCVTPFFMDGKWVILLALTSNSGSADFQKQQLGNGRLLYEEVMEITSQYGSPDNTMYVVGATHPEELARLRTRFPQHFFLIPGVGVQGGDMTEIAKASLTKDGGILVNASRSILYASSELDFAEKANEEARRLNSLSKSVVDALF